MSECWAGAKAGSHPHKSCALTYDLRGSGPPAIFIQGLGIHGCCWKPQIDALAPHYECLSFDNRGLGLSQPLGAALTIEQMAEDALALMDAFEWPSAHVVGQSMGGLIAVHLALTARARVQSLSLLSSFARGRDVLPSSLAMLQKVDARSIRLEAPETKSVARTHDARGCPGIDRSCPPGIGPGAVVRS